MFLSLILLATGCAHQRATPEPVVVPLHDTVATKIDALIKQSMQADQIPGMAVGVIRNNQVAYRKGYGFAEAGTSRVVTPQTVFQLGSDSKMMVGIAVMQLVQQKKLDLDAPVASYLPYFRIADPRYTSITIREMMSHRSGLPWCANYDKCNFLDYESPETDAGSLERHVREIVDVKLATPPGETMQYSDLGFEIIGDVIAKVSGQSFEDYIHDHVIAPMQLTHTSFILSDIPPQLLAAPHVLDPTLRVNPFYPYSRQHAPSSHLFSNVDDINRYALVQLDQGRTPALQLITPASYQRMWTAEIATNMESPWERTLGIGWFLGEYDGHRLVGHGGGDTGFACGFVMAPNDGIAVVVMQNREVNAEELAFKIMALLLNPDADHPNITPAAH